jgi:hypothetical protein
MAQLIDWIWTCTAVISSPLVFAVLFVLARIFMYALFPLTKRHYPNVSTFDGNPWGFSVAEAPSILGKFDAKQLAYYRKQELLTDLFFPIVYGLLFAVAMVLIGNRTGASHWLILLPYGAAIADYLENFSIVGMIGRHLRGQPLGAFAVVGSIASRFKHGLLFATVLVLLGLGGWALWEKYL